LGIVPSFAHPGGNITGLSILGLELYGKRLELLKDALPQIRHVAFLFNPANPVYRSVLKGMEIVAKSLIVEVRPHEVRTPNEFENAFVTMVERRVDAAVVSEDGMIYANNRTIAVLAEKHQLPTIGGFGYAEAGGLLGYWVDRLEETRRMTVFVDKILKGAEPGDLPIEQAAKLQFTVNLNIAKALGLTIPPSVLVRADRLIE
jgi:putative ABC transport system substrate-binding protein